MTSENWIYEPHPTTTRPEANDGPGSPGRGSGLAAGRVNGGLAAIIVTVVLMLVAKRALKADDRDLLSRRLAQRIMARYGTRFAGADLTRTSFAGTSLTQADLSEAVLDDAV